MADAPQQIHINATTIEVVRGNIVDQHVDAIVNAANSALAGGGGVDGVIHRTGGPSIMAELDEIRKIEKGCPTGKAVITGAGNLNAKYVIHAVGPIYRGGSSGEAKLLADAHWNSLEIADQHRAKTIAFPAISTGAYGYPIREAADIAIASATRYCTETRNTALQLIRFVLFDHEAYSQFARALTRER